MISLDKYKGCFLGLAIGDAYGAPFEGGPIERLLWKLIGKTKDGKIRYTDDTQMSIDLASSYVQNNGINQDHLADTFAKSYRWSRGYGPSAGRLLKKIKNGVHWKKVNRAKFKEGSFGNGAAMRAPILAMCYPEGKGRLIESIIESSEITHAHPLAIEGAKLIAFVTQAALHDLSTEYIIQVMPDWCNSEQYKEKVTFCIESIKSDAVLQDKVIKNKLGNGIAAIQSTITAIYFSLKYREQSFDSMQNKIHKLGGDADTIGAMAGAIWGAFNGSELLDKNKIELVEDSETIILLAGKLHDLMLNRL
jgi:poly(ADP-ribose) glycohydrolase ARH3